MSIENSHKLNEQWLSQIDVNSKKTDDVFLRRSDVIRLGHKHTVQIALMTPPGLNRYDNEINIGYNLEDAGYFPIKRLFQKFGSPSQADLALSIKIENTPKKGKKRSGDMPAVVVLHEHNKGVERILILNILVDNLSTESDKRYGIFNYKSDSYSSDCQKDSLVNSVEKIISFSEYIKQNFNHISVGKYGPGFNNGFIPNSSREFRDNVLNLFSDQLPDSPNYSEISRGIYGVSVIDISYVPNLGFTGNSIILRSNADILAIVNNESILDDDSHYPAEAVAVSLGANSFERYQAKLNAKIYDVCGPNYKDQIGGLEITKHDIFRGEGYYIGSDEKHGNVNHSVFLQSDGYKKGADFDDVSMTQVQISGYYFN